MDRSELKKETCSAVFGPNEENEFFELLETLTEVDAMKTEPLGSFKVVTANEDDEEISTGLYLEDEDGKYRLPESALFSIRRRYKNMAEIFAKMSPEDQAKMLNMSIPYLEEEEVQLYTREDLVIGLHSKHYSPIEQLALFRSFDDNLMLSYDEYRFLSGSYRHDLTEAVYEITDLETTEKYVKALIGKGEKVGTKDVTFHTALRTSDAASCSVSVQPYVLIGDKTAPLSPAMHLDHRDGITLKDAKDMFEKIYSYNASAVDNLRNMMDIELEHPSAVIRRLTKKYRLPLKPMKEIAMRFATESSGRKMSAYELYINACLIMRSDKFASMKAARQIEAEDSLAKILLTTKEEWAKIDKPGPTLFD